MEHKNELEVLELLLPAVIFGAEEDGSDEPSSEGGDADENEDNDDDAGSDDDDHDDSDDERTKGLRSALRKERARANKAEKAAKAAQREKEERELAEKTEIEQAQIRAQKANERAERLSNGFLQTSLNAAIREAAKNAGFIDPSDAIEGVDRTGITYDQDEDDPSQVDIDEKTVIAAVKKLATRKPHFIKSGTDDGEPTGGQFGGSKKKKMTSEEELKQKYSALR